VSLLLALLRKRLAEFDAGESAGARCVVDRDQLVEMLRVFLPAASNEARFVTEIESHLAKIVDLGFLARVKGQDDNFEIRRILKAFVDGQWLADFEGRLRDYRDQLAAEEESE
jgi:hypothetical protein